MSDDEKYMFDWATTKDMNAQEKLQAYIDSMPIIREAVREPMLEALRSLVPAVEGVLEPGLADSVVVTDKTD